MFLFFSETKIPSNRKIFLNLCVSMQTIDERILIEKISSIRIRFKNKFTVRKKKEDPTAPEAAKEGAGNTFTAVKDAWVRVATKCLLKENLSPTL